MEYIYIVIAQTGTRPAQFFKMITRKPFNHASLSGTADLSDMYSFCRTYPSFPFPATFNREIVGKGTLGLYDNIPCEIYRIAVTKKQKDDYNTLIRHFVDNRSVYSYNILGLPLMYLNIEWKREHSFVCSQFVAYILDRVGVELEKPFSLYTPDDFRRFPNAELFYAGELNRFHNNITADEAAASGELLRTAN